MSQILTEILKALLAFLFTTALGGAVAYIFQMRQAKAQWARIRWEKEVEEKQAAFEEISRLLDRRLYRTRQLYWSLKRTEEARAPWLKEYKKVVCEWNDGINRTLAILMIQFGADARKALDFSIGTDLVQIGGALENALKQNLGQPPGIENRLNEVANKIYQFNLTLLTAIQSRRSQRPDS